MMSKRRLRKKLSSSSLSMQEPGPADLPNHFERRFDERSGRFYFIDHKTRTTSWVDPRDAHIKPLTFEECYESELPFGWETAVDPDVGLYYIDHNTWTTQLEDPRDGVIRHGRFLKTKSNLEAPAYVQPSSRQLKNKLAAAQAELIRLQQEQTDGSTNPHLERQILSAMKKVNDLRKQLSRLKAGEIDLNIHLNQAPVEPSSAVSSRPPSGLSTQSGLTNSDLHRLFQTHDKGLESLSERENLKRSLLETELRRKQEGDIADLRMEMLRMQLEHERSTNQSRLEGDMHGIAAKLESQAQQTEASFRALISQRDQERSKLDETTIKMVSMMKAQEQRELDLTRTLSRVQAEHEATAARLAELERMRQREAAMLKDFVDKGINLEDYVSREALNARLRKLDEEYMRELEATTDVFMPQTKIKEGFDKQAAEIDELRRMIKARDDDGRRKRIWNDNLQTFVEEGRESGRSSPSGRTPRTSPMQPRRGLRRNNTINPIIHVSPAGHEGREHFASRGRSLDDRELLTRRDVSGARRSHTSRAMSESSARELVSPPPSRAPATASYSTTATSPTPRMQDEVDALSQLNTQLEDAEAQAAAKLDRTRRTLEKSRYRDSLSVDQEELTFMLKQGKFRHIDPARGEFEDWMNDAELCRQLKLHQEEFDQLEDARSELQRRIADLQARQRNDPGDLTFDDKLAFFATSSSKSAPTSRPGSATPGQRALIKGSMGVKYDQSFC
eukprot:TRINITY_DN12472_c0_g1_i2.p1 TRINITY_DN12472_c0_g1~~TRINITY_DN12472_c0_g1_i2.p1  ORF type:complete len:732 (+),score=169.50 TRINITY_DN12472_c0_g1_i2:29-2224(+)